MSNTETEAGATKVCLLSTNRSGSSWMTDLLQSHPDLRMYGEAFHRGPARVASWNKHLIAPVRHHEFHLTSSKRRPWRTFSYLDELATHHEGKPAVGFNLMYEHVRWWPEIWVKLIADQYRVVHLYRENHLDIFLSREFMKRRNRRHTTEKLEKESLLVDTSSLLPYLHRKEVKERLWRGLVRWSPLPNTEVRYDELRENRNETLNRIVDFLGLQPLQLESHFQRVNRGTHREKIENYEEVKSVLQGTRFYRFLDEVPEPARSSAGENVARSALRYFYRKHLVDPTDATTYL